MRDVPCCSPADYARELLVLFDGERIEFESTVAENNVNSRSGIIHILDRLLQFSQLNPDAILNRRIRHTNPDPRNIHRPDLIVAFKLTKKGGESWETIAEPNWRRFLEGFTNFDGDVPRPASAELASQDLNLLLAHLAWFRDEWTESTVYGPELDSINLQFHEEYQALYWKRLPSVYKATFALTPVQPLWPKGPRGEPHWHQEPKWFTDWRDTSHKWFTLPWELPDWPA